MALLLQLNEHHSFVSNDAKQLEPLVGKPVTLEQLASFDFPITIHPNAPAGVVIIDSPYSW